jgi:hypothetical protein
MFDADAPCGSNVSAFDPSEERPSKRQYTLKGIEVETIQLMRDAASKEGMKIGSWVSLRMKEAAERALSSEGSQGPRLLRTSRIESKSSSYAQPEIVTLVEHVLAALDQHREITSQRFIKLESELHEITSGQRTILSALLAQR